MNFRLIESKRCPCCGCVPQKPDLKRFATFAAAPELLEALRVAVSYIGKGVADGAFSACAVSGEKALEKMQATIRKAEGR